MLERESSKQDVTVKDKQEVKQTSAEKAGQTAQANNVSQISSERRTTVLENHDYTLGETIGSGSYAMVKLAYSKRHESFVAIKIISKFEAPSEILRKFLPREIDVVKILNHPNIIKFLQAIETTHRVYIIMEYAESGTLLEAIRKSGYIDEVKAKHWFRQLVEAIGHCHLYGVVHRDIKCENILLDRELNIKVSDFGFARRHMNPTNGHWPLSETFCGSYAYASPEVLRAVPYQPQLSDIWSMGVVLYAMVYGRLPFNDTNLSQLIKLVQRPVVFHDSPSVSESCQSLLRGILAALRKRLTIPQIKVHPWLQASQAEVAILANHRTLMTSTVQTNNN